MQHPFPYFSVFDTQTKGESLHLFGKVSAVKYGRETWVGDGHVGYLFVKKPVLCGRWHELNGGWKFTVSEKLEHTADVSAGCVFEILDGYWGERAEVVLDSGLTWSELLYEEESDHEHCFICWATICVAENRQHMSSERDTRLCKDCYASYVVRRSLAFIPFQEK